MSNYTGNFTDSVTFDGRQKTAISVRDGVLEYLGAELGMEPADKVFTVYRSPAQIARVSPVMDGLPLTDEHVTVGSDVTDKQGSVQSSEVIDFADGNDSRLAVQNRIDLSDAMLDTLQSGKRELSLGYGAELAPHDKYDFQQVNIKPHHLAVVDKGRCGAGCSFLDKLANHEEPDMGDKNKGPDMQALKDSIAELSADQRKELGFGDEEKPAVSFKDAPTASQVVELLGSFEADQISEVSDEIKALMGTTDAKGSDDKGDEVPVTDTAQFRDAVASAVAGETKRYAQVVDKARQFVADDYDFADKSADQIMRDALATEHGSTAFEDAELPVAFKLLRKSASQLKTFGDSVTKGKFTKLADKEF